MGSGWHPYFTYYFAPGKGYLAGDFFFPKEEKPKCISYLEKISDAERAVVIRHIAVSAQILASGGKVCNCLIHPSVRQVVHSKFQKAIIDELNWCRDNLDQQFKAELKGAYDDLAPMKHQKVEFDTIFNIAKELLGNNRVNVIVMNGKNDVSSEEYSTG